MGTQGAIDRSALVLRLRMRFLSQEIVGHIVEFSSDQYGSRFIQTKVENCEPGELEIIAREILPNHALPLMSDVFGNYVSPPFSTLGNDFLKWRLQVIQRIFENGTDADRQMLISQMRGSILALSLQMYGCRVVQKVGLRLATLPASR